MITHVLLKLNYLHLVLELLIAKINNFVYLCFQIVTRLTIEIEILCLQLTIERLVKHFLFI